MKPYYDDGKGIVIYCADCREVLPTLNDGSADFVLADPPYGVGVAAWDKTVPYEMLNEMLRVSAGPVVWFGAAPRLRESLMQFSVPPQRVLIWHVTFSMARRAANGIYFRWHPIYAWRLPKRHAGPCRDVLAVPQSGHNFWYHPGTKPTKLIQQLIGFCPVGGTVVDPYLGSGTTVVAAAKTGRRAIGVEIDERYCEIAVRRLQLEVVADEKK